MSVCVAAEACCTHPLTLITTACCHCVRSYVGIKLRVAEGKGGGSHCTDLKRRDNDTPSASRYQKMVENILILFFNKYLNLSMKAGFVLYDM